MSEVDKLSSSGLYPTLPIPDKRKERGPAGKPPGSPASVEAADGAGEHAPRSPKSIIDEYA